jgi:nitrous oxidase accessory protein NosD
LLGGGPDISQAVNLTGTISDNTITDAQGGLDGIILDATAKMTVTNNNITGPGSAELGAIYVFQSDQPSITGNTVSDVYGGIYLDQVGPATVSSNKISNVGGAGFVVSCSHNNSVYFNNTTDSPDIGAVGMDIQDCQSIPP